MTNIKKIVILSILGLFALSAQCLAAQGDSYDSVATDFKHSHNVTSAYYTANNDMDYAVNVKHTAGDRLFATTNNSNIMYQQDDTYKGQNVTATGDTINAGNAGDNTSAFDSAWSEM